MTHAAILRKLHNCKGELLAAIESKSATSENRMYSFVCYEDFYAYNDERLKHKNYTEDYDYSKWQLKNKPVRKVGCNVIT
uniref:Uncharacterized protein n=1 Tax=Romanomermis culicivorax TaxID=13658 RepID=A0A915J8H4_ROMCU